jgi:hypothetical protein
LYLRDELPDAIEAAFDALVTTMPCRDRRCPSAIERRWQLARRSASRSFNCPNCDRSRCWDAPRAPDMR